MSKHVELEVHTGVNLVTGETETFSQYMIYICEDDSRQNVGLVGWGEDCKILFTKPTDPITADWVRSEVDNILGRSGTTSVPCPELPAELVESESVKFDEFDEEELTG